MLNQAEAQSVLDGEYNVFNTQAESTRTWISELSQPLTTPDRDTNMEEMKSKAQVSESGVYSNKAFFWEYFGVLLAHLLKY